MLRRAFPAAIVLAIISVQPASAQQPLSEEYRAFSGTVSGILMQAFQVSDILNALAGPGDASVNDLSTIGLTHVQLVEDRVHFARLHSNQIKNQTELDAAAKQLATLGELAKAMEGTKRFLMKVSESGRTSGARQQQMFALIRSAATLQLIVSYRLSLISPVSPQGYLHRVELLEAQRTVELLEDVLTKDRRALDNPGGVKGIFKEKLELTSSYFEASEAIETREVRLERIQREAHCAKESASLAQAAHNMLASRSDDARNDWHIQMDTWLACPISRLTAASENAPKPKDPGLTPLAR